MMTHKVFPCSKGLIIEQNRIDFTFHYMRIKVHEKNVGFQSQEYFHFENTGKVVIFEKCVSIGLRTFSIVKFPSQLLTLFKVIWHD